MSAASILEGWQPLAGGQRSATTGKESISPVVPHPGGMPAGFWHPAGMRRAVCHRSGGIAALNHRLMARNPPGSSRIADLGLLRTDRR